MRISVKHVIRNFFYVVFLLSMMHIILMVLNYGFDWPLYENFAKIFHLNAEQSIPAYFSTILLFISSILLWVIGKVADTDSGKWKLLSVLFLMMSVDEMASLHEKLIPLMRSLTGENQFFYWGWTIPAALFMIIFGIIFFPFWKRLPGMTRKGMMWAGIIYVAGALILEMAESLYFYQIRTYRDIWLDLMFLIEETMEMVGIVIFIYTLLMHIRNHVTLENIEIVKSDEVI